MVSIAAGKYWTATVTDTGDVYVWDGKKGKDKPPVAMRLPGVKKASSVSVGETHMLIVGSLYHPVYLSNVADSPSKLNLEVGDELEELDNDFMFNDLEPIETLPPVQKVDTGYGSIPSLMSLCEKVAAECLVEPRNSLQLLEIADSLEADNLKKHCEVLSVTCIKCPFTFFLGVSEYSMVCCGSLVVDI